MKYKNKFFLYIVCVIIICTNAFTINNNSSKDYAFCFSSKSAVVIEAKSGRVLLENNKDIRLPMASTTKIMTSLVALENTSNLDDVFATDNRAVGIEGTSIYLKKDEHLSMRDLLYGLMLASGNDASLAIAYKVSGSLEKFVELMNRKADELQL